MTHWWPTLNAGLNAASALAVVVGYACIRRRRIGPHIACMVLACIASAAFFVSYVLYHAQAGVVHFSGSEWLRGVYLAILTSHTILAVIIVPLVVITVRLAAQRRYEAHQRWARLTLPLWLYVSVTGIVVYAMLYHLP